MEKSSFRKTAALLLTRADLHEHDESGRSGFEILAGSAIPEVRSLLQTLPPVDSAKAAEYAAVAKAKIATLRSDITAVDATIEKLRRENDELRGLNQVSRWPACLPACLPVCVRSFIRSSITLVLQTQSQNKL